MTERVLVLNVDIDNDLYRKTKISGPLIGRIENLRAASKLALADPQDSDSNAMFEAVRKYDELKHQRVSVSVATVTGAEKEGYVADTELSRQIDMVIERVKADSCILVTDGSSDARVVPLLKNRLRIDSIDIVRMKQAAGAGEHLLHAAREAQGAPLREDSVRHPRSASPALRAQLLLQLRMAAARSRSSAPT